MLELQRGQRAILVEKLPDLANLAAATLFFGQFLSENAFSLAAAAGGVTVWMGLMGTVMVFASKETDR